MIRKIIEGTLAIIFAVSGCMLDSYDWLLFLSICIISAGFLFHMLAEDGWLY